jgi:hypothetical protein
VKENLMRFGKLVIPVLFAAAMASRADAQEVYKTGLSEGGFSVLAGEGDHFERKVPDGGTITAIKSKFGVGVDSVTLTYEDANGDQGELPKIGGDGGDHAEALTIGRSEVLTGIKVKSGVRVDSITWVLKNKKTGRVREVKMGGNGGDQYTEIDVPAGHRIIGIYGRADRACLCKVGLLYVKE